MTPAVAMLVVRVLLALALYAFLGVLVWMLWRDVRAAGQVSAARTRPRGRLVIVETSLPGLALGATFPLLPLTSVGRAPTNTVPLPDDTASLEHALLHLRDGQWWLEDLDSRNGTRLNDSPLSGPAPMMAGDVVGVGRTKLRLELE